MTSAAALDLLERVRVLCPAIAARAEATEQARRLPEQSVREMLQAGIARILMPTRFGGYGLDFETWYDVAVEISRADASHGWCASLIIHHAHIVAQLPEAAQQAVWADGPDVAIAASFAPRAEATRVAGGYRLSGQTSTFASAIDNSTWVMIGAMLRDGGAPEWLLLLVPPGDYKVVDQWFTAGMRGTGSNTVVTDNVFVPESHMITRTNLMRGKGLGGTVHENPIYRTPFYFYAPLTFAAPMLGAAQGAYGHFREWIKTRRSVDGSLVAEKLSTQVRMAQAAASLDAAELLLQRASRTPETLEAVSQQLLARSIRDFTRVSELTMEAIDALLGLAGAAGFASSHPVQRAWRDIHFAATHIALNPEGNYGHFGRVELGLPVDPNRSFL
jgi:3-hydroxy-9,10-secoandrosta-1,3,5(10)-triene-9,17-dione monooxygenase